MQRSQSAEALTSRLYASHSRKPAASWRQQSLLRSQSAASTGTAKKEEQWTRSVASPASPSMQHSLRSVGFESKSIATEVRRSRWGVVVVHKEQWVVIN